MTIKEELEQIANDNGGVLNPADVVEFARNKKTALHSQFQWDDTEAARQYRLWQARHLIRYQIEIVQHDRQEIPFRIYHSLESDRGEDGGYRRTVDILSDEDLRAQLLDEAREEMKRFREKYSSLTELSKVFASIKAAEKTIGKKK